MSSIILKNSLFKYEISENAENLCFSFANSDINRIVPTPCALITNNDKSIVYANKASFKNDVLYIAFSDGTNAEVLTDCTKSYITFTLKAVSRTDFLSISFVNIQLDDNSDDYYGCLIGMTLSTHMHEHPGDNRLLRASAYPHIGLFSTNKSSYPAKAAVIGTSKDELRDIQKLVLNEIPKGELPLSFKGGPYADLVSKEARGTYTVFSQTVNEDNIDDVIDSLRRFSITQITLHHYGHYTQGDFKFDRKIFPNGMTDFRKIVDRLHSEGFLVGLQTYAFFLVPESEYFTPVPHKDLDILREFTLKESICASDTEISVLEAVDDVSLTEGYLVNNSTWLWINDELIRFRNIVDGKFTECERGAFGTVPSAHDANSSVRQLKQYFFLPLARAGSDLFYEIARKTAEFFNESNADYLYLDALDGAFVLDGEDYVWYHAMDFIREMFKYFKRDPIFDCCYNPQYTSSWFVRSRYGAIDESLLAHKQYIDAHLNYNLTTAHRMAITPELGWVDLYPNISDTSDMWQVEPFTAEDLENLCAKAYATNASLAFLRKFHKYKSLPCSEAYCSILKKYEDYKKDHSPSENITNYLSIPENSAILVNNELIRSKYKVGTVEHNGFSFDIDNEFSEQAASFRIDPLCAASDYDYPDGVTLCRLSEDSPITSMSFRFDKPVSSNGNRGLGVWCYGDNSGAIICIQLRNFAMNCRKKAQYFIRADFSGWKYFAFYEHQNGTLPTEDWQRQELEYPTYLDLQDFYHHYRANMNYDAIDGVDIIVKGSENIRLRSLRFVPHIEPVWVEPVIKTDRSELKIHAKLYPGNAVCYDGEKCIITDKIGNVIDTPACTGKFIIPNGKSSISMYHGDSEKYVRAKITVTLRGEKI